MNRIDKVIKYQLFTGETVAADLEPAISVDFTSRLHEGIQTLAQILGVTTMEPMAEGTQIKIYQYGAVTLAEQANEGATIGLTEITRSLAATKTLTLKKYRKQTTAESIQKVGRQLAINGTDEKLVGAIRKTVKTDFFSMLATGTGTASGVGLQAALAAAWGKLQKRYEDIDVTPIYFVSSDDVADYLGSATLTMQTAFGFTYIENFLGLGTAIVFPGLSSGTVYATAKENLHGAYIPATGGDLAATFGLTSDESGLVGMGHYVKSDNAAIDTLALCGVMFYPEYADGVIKGTIATSA